MALSPFFIFLTQLDIRYRIEIMDLDSEEIRNYGNNGYTRKSSGGTDDNNTNQRMGSDMAKEKSFSAQTTYFNTCL